jgi:hypothetical protein
VKPFLGYSKKSRSRATIRDIPARWRIVTKGKTEYGSGGGTRFFLWYFLQHFSQFSLGAKKFFGQVWHGHTFCFQGFSS